MKATTSSILALGLLATCFLAAPLHAQAEPSLRIELAAPMGFSDLPGRDGGRRFVYRSENEANNRVSIEVGIIDSDAMDEANYLISLGETDRKTEDDADFSLLGETVPGRMYSGVSEGLRGKRYFHRLIVVKNVAEGRFLKVESTVFHAAPLMPADLKEKARRATLDVISKIKVMKSDEDPPESREEIKANESQSGRFINDKVLPFSFTYPINWSVFYADMRAPGLLWVVATPKDQNGAFPNEDDIRVALRVTAYAFVPELVGCDDELQRATAIVKNEYALRQSRPELEQIDEALLGNAKGRIFRFREQAGLRDAGLLLVVAADAGMLVAEFRCLGDDFRRLEATGLDILGSFNLSADRGEKTIDAKPFTLTAPSGFEIEEVGTEDSSRAWTLRRPGQELFLRSSLLPEGETISPLVLRKLAGAYFADTLGITSREVVEGAIPLSVPGSENGIQRFLIIEKRSIDQRAVDLFAFTRGGAVHFAILSSKDGLRDRHQGRLISLLSKLSGPKPVVPDARMQSSGTFDRRICLRFMEPHAFNSEGAFLGSKRGSLILEPDGKALLDWRSPKESYMRQGRYSRVGKQIYLNLGDPQPLIFDWSESDGHAQDSSGQTWYPASSF